MLGCTGEYNGTLISRDVYVLKQGVACRSVRTLFLARPPLPNMTRKNGTASRIPSTASSSTLPLKNRPVIRIQASTTGNPTVLLEALLFDVAKAGADSQSFPRRASINSARICCAGLWKAGSPCVAVSKRTGDPWPYHQGLSCFIIMKQHLPFAVLSRNVELTTKDDLARSGVSRTRARSSAPHDVAF